MRIITTKNNYFYLTTASCVLEATVWKTAGIIRDSSTFISMSFSVEKVVFGIAGGRSHKIISLLKRKIGFVSCSKKKTKTNWSKTLQNIEHAHCPQYKRRRCLTLSSAATPVPNDPSLSTCVEGLPARAATPVPCDPSRSACVGGLPARAAFLWPESKRV